MYTYIYIHMHCRDTGTASTRQPLCTELIPYLFFLPNNSLSLFAKETKAGAEANGNPHGAPLISLGLILKETHPTLF